jgi:hypothetical protein
MKALLLCLLTTSALAATPDKIEFFESKIRPVLAQDCYECHATATKKKGGLLLDSRPGWQAGGDSGPAVVPGDAAKSLLIQSIRHEHEDLAMPKNGAKLDADVIAAFEKWVNDGAVDPRDTPPSAEQIAKDTDWQSVLERRKQWWALQPLKDEGGRMNDEKGNPVDVFIEAKMAEQGLNLSPPADQATLLRRLSYVLTGLPPSPAEIESFAQRCQDMGHSSLKAIIEAEVARLLSSPRYGETWARHWLDWVRYAESYGSEGDPAIPYVWRYRDYVIRAFNDDVPYPQMVREAIAGDLLAKPRIKEGINESALGIGQLRMVLHGFSPTDSLDEMVTFTDNQIDVVTKAFQGLTVSCARCHNHKFDAISQTDFYALYGIFTSTRPAVIDVNAPDVGKQQREALAKLKQQIKAIVGKAWLEKTPPSKATVAKATEGTPISNDNILMRWDPRRDTIYTSGNGFQQGATKAGEFSIALDGKSTLARIYPSGVFSDLISTKDRAVLMSPRFKCEGGTLWMRTTGGGSSRAKYVVQNYPRTGTIHKAKTFEGDDDAGLGWHSLDLNYWKGDDMFIQVATASDMPAEIKADERSWIGLAEVIITKDATPPPKPAKATDVRASIEAWLNNTLTDAQAELLNTQLQSGKLPNDIAEAAPLVAKYRKIEAALPMPTRAPGVLEADGHDAAMFVRGDHKQPGEIVARRFLDGIDPIPIPSRQSGRLELAEKFADLEANPLAARVIVNRLWHHVFGRGIVGTTDNFGKLGDLPTHPELLDYLAQRFIDSGGSIKDMIKLLVTSKTFQASDQASAKATKIDPDNKLLSHWTVRRLPAEPIRDSILTLSGKLDDTMFGLPINDEQPRRSLYMKVIRNRMDPFLSAFDMPVPMTTKGRRDVTNVPAQSLALLNDQNVTKWASQWAKQVTRQQADDTARVQQMFAQAFSRKANTDELAACLAFVQSAAQSAKSQQAELAVLENEAETLQKKINDVLDPQRAKLTEQRQVKPANDAPKPYAEWDFEKDANDLQGNLPLTLEGSARLEQGALVLDGRSAVARSAPLTKDLSVKTLEAWVLLDTLDQRGGGVITVQDKRGGVFDSIVFAESAANEWLAGSDHHKRTEGFEGTPETEAAQRPVHVAITYAGGTTTAYRDGLLYGKSYQVGEPANFKAVDSEVILGCRHGKAGGNRLLRGRILRARLYDRALSDKELATSRLLESSVINDRDVLAALPEPQRQALNEWQGEYAKVVEQAHEVKARVEQLSPETAGWESLALSLINLKEFVYLK